MRKRVAAIAACAVLICCIAYSAVLIPRCLNKIRITSIEELTALLNNR